MTAKSYLRGHEIEWDGNEWVYSDTKQSTVKAWRERLCGYCYERATPDGHDACLGTLPGIMNACCGHGITGKAYVQFWDKSCIRGDDALTIMDVLKRYREDWNDQTGYYTTKSI